MNRTFDAIVVGAGYIGCSVAYHLTAAGVRTVLLDQGGVAAGASRANYGNVQIQDAELAHSLPMITTAHKHFDRLEDKLGDSAGFRRLGSLLLIETESQWRTIAARLPALHSAGIPAELVPGEQLPEIEPQLDHTTVLGACYHPNEGQVSPFALIRAYLRQARKLGLTLDTHTCVTGIDIRGGRVQGVETNKGTYQGPVVVLATGAWTPQLGHFLGRQWQIPHVHGQALVTAHVRPCLHSHIESAAFFEDIEEADGSDAGAVLAVCQTGHGNLLLGEAGRVTDDLGKATTASGQAAIAGLIGRYFPALGNLSVLRGWAAPVAFTPDGLPFWGYVDGIDGLILATAFKSTVIVTPLVGETVAEMVESGSSSLDLAPFSPDREIPGGDV